MGIQKLQIRNFRNLENVELSPHPNFNLLFGANGSGKTSLLESINIISVGRSFRTNQPTQYISHHQNSCDVYCEISSLNEAMPTRMGISKAKNGRSLIRVNGRDEMGATVLAEHLPLQLITPASIELIEGSGKNRRQFMDWGVFHVEHQFLNWWRNAQRLLKQRNALLKQLPRTRADLGQLEAWDRELVSYAEPIAECRKQYLQNLKEVFNESFQDVCMGLEIDFIFNKGWPEDIDLSTALEISRERDRKLGYTQYGPHRADFRVVAGGYKAHEVLSRGQKKILVCALKCTQAKILKQVNNRDCVFLVDDLAAELDGSNQKWLWEILMDLSTQVFITAVSPEPLLPAMDGYPIKMFHVEHGAIS